MFADLHAMLIILTVIVPAIVVGVSHGWVLRPLRAIAVPTLVIACVGVFSMLLEFYPGAPTSEWLFPLLAIVISGLFVKSPKAFDLLCRCLPWAAILLSINHLVLLLRGEYTSAPLRAERLFRTEEEGRLDYLGIELRRRFSPERSFPAGALRAIMPESPETDIPQNNVVAMWYSKFTG